MIVEVSREVRATTEVAKGWHRKFLWLPEYMSDTGERRWLEFVWRRVYIWNSYTDPYGLEREFSVALPEKNK